MKQSWIRAVLIVLTLLWMALIFGFSSQSSEESGDMSAIITEPVTDFITSFDEDLTQEEWNDTYWRVDGIIRNGAHFTEYAVLGVLLCLTFSSFGTVRLLLPWATGAAYAIADEIHQSFSPGRVCDLVDVMIDAAGVLCGAWIIHRLIKCRRNHHVHHS